MSHRDLLTRAPHAAPPTATRVHGRGWRIWLAILLAVTAVDATIHELVAAAYPGRVQPLFLLPSPPPVLALIALLPLAVLATRWAGRRAASRITHHVRDRCRRVRWWLAASTVWHATAAGCTAATTALAHPHPIDAVRLVVAALLAFTACAAARTEPWLRRWR